MAEVQTQPVDVAAAEGLVLVSGRAIAGTLTPDAAMVTAERLIEAAHESVDHEVRSRSGPDGGCQP